VTSPRPKPCPAWLLAGLLGTSLAGCASLPEAQIGPFVDTSIELHSAVAASGSAVTFELRQMQGGETQAERFAKLWPVRVQATEALVQYATSLKAIVDSGQQGQAAARGVANGLTALSRDVGITLPAAGVAGVATDTAAFVYGQIAAVRASRTLAEALKNAQPVVDRITVLMAQDLEKAGELLKAANADVSAELEIARQVEIGFRNELLAERKGLYARGLQGLGNADKARLKEIDALIASTESWYGPLQAQLEQIQTRLVTGERLIAATAQATLAWSATHRQLLAAVEEKRPVNPVALASAITEVQDLIRRIRAL